MSDDRLPSMPVEDALNVLAKLRGEDQVVITNQSSARHWPRLSTHPLDFNYNPSTMGGAVPLGLGVALGRPDREVIVVSGDGSLLMSLGCLVTVASAGVTNLTVVLLDNGLYEVTGGQKTPAAGADVDFAGLARAAGFPNVAHFWDVNDWRDRAATTFNARGPRFIWLQVGPTPADVYADRAAPITERLAEFERHIQG